MRPFKSWSVPWKIICPLLRTAAWLHTSSTSERLWLERIIVFSAASVLINSSIERRASMSSPCVGSSQMSRSGSLMRLAATASRAVMPGVKWAMASPECGSKSTARISPASRGLRVSRGIPNSRAM